jgi:hypothetical protein
MRWQRTVSLLGIVSILNGGCAAHTTHVFSNPQGAKVYVNGEFLGTTPTVYKDKGAFQGASFTFRVELEGYKTITRIFEQEFDTGTAGIEFVVGLFLCAPVCCAIPWAYALQDQVAFEVEPGTGETEDRIPVQPPPEERE